MAAEKIVTESALAALASDAKRAIYDVLPGGSATGNPCSFDTDIAVPLKSLLANIIASGGNGSPDSPIPIVGHSELNLVRCGVNLGNLKVGGRSNNGVTYTVVNNTEIAMTGTATATSWAFEQITDVSKLIYLPAGTYRLSGGESWNVVLYLVGKYIDGTNIPQVYDSGSGANITLTMPAYVYIQLQVSNGTATDRSIYPMLVKGSTALPYAPYNGETFTVSFGQTVYGGVYDANAGKVRITHQSVMIDGSYFDGYSADGWTRGVFSGAEQDNAKTKTSMYPVGGSSGDRFTWLVQGYFRIYDSSFASLADVQTKFNANPMQLVYTLATPIEIDVSELAVDTIVGTNNITSDCGGDVEVEYRESVEKYVNDHSATRTDVVGTLTAGQTSITLSSTAITTSSTIGVFTDPEVPYNSLTVTSGQAVLTFDAQANNVSVKVRVT